MELRRRIEELRSNIKFKKFIQEKFNTTLPKNFGEFRSVIKLKIEKFIQEKFISIPPKNFEEWSLNKTPVPKSAVNTNHPERVLTPPNLEEGFPNLIDDIINKPDNWPWNLTLDNNFPKDFEMDFSNGKSTFFDPSQNFPGEIHHFSTLQISKVLDIKKFLIKGAMIGQVNIQTVGSTEVVFENCCIGELNIRIPNPKNIVTLKNCWVAKIEFRKKSINNLNVEAGWICEVICPPPDGDNPFTGSVNFSNVSFPTSTKGTNLFHGPQQYRNLRSHFEKLNNGSSAGLMRANELASNHENEQGVSLLFSWFYGLASNFGMSPGKPLWNAFRLYLVAVVFILLWDGGGPTDHRMDSAGWASNLNRLERSAILPLQSILNPVGAFRQNQVLFPETKLGKVWIIVNGFLCDGLLLFFILGLRKHFKLN